LVYDETVVDPFREVSFEPNAVIAGDAADGPHGFEHSRYI
jgi:hypothetical protein